jgi:hypothetical protein
MQELSDRDSLRNKARKAGIRRKTRGKFVPPDRRKRILRTHIARQCFARMILYFFEACAWTSREMTKMRIPFAALVLAVGSSAGQADSLGAEGARFVAMTPWTVRVRAPLSPMYSHPRIVLNSPHAKCR